MIFFHRRNFLKTFGATFLASTSIGKIVKANSLSFPDFLASSNISSRKLALLIGINQYESENIPNLRGCVNDVELQRQLLIHRFGFNDADIFQIKDVEATRENILTAFEEHLIQQAFPEDIVVIHFSGHSEKVFTSEGQEVSWMATDAEVSSKDNQRGFIMWRTIHLLLEALRTEKVTTVVDTAFAGGINVSPSNEQSRSLSKKNLFGTDDLKPSEEELQYQAIWLERLSITLSDFLKVRLNERPKGMILAAARVNQLASELSFQDFLVGAFTYSLTQYLWRNSGTFKEILGVVNVITGTRARERGIKQGPVYIGNFEQEDFYFIDVVSPVADAVVLSTLDNLGEVWLGGLDLSTLQDSLSNPSFDVLTKDGDRIIGIAQLTNRNGLTGIVTYSGEILPGALLLQTDISILEPILFIGVSQNLEDSGNPSMVLDRLSSTGFIQPIGSSSIASPVDYQLSYFTPRIKAPLAEEGLSKLPELNSIGLLLGKSFDPILSSFGQSNEKFEEAADRLEITFAKLLISKVLRKILNFHQTPISIVAELLEEADASSPVARETSIRIRGGGISANTSENTKENQYQSKQARAKATISVVNLNHRRGTPIELNDEFYFQIENLENETIYISILSVQDDGDFILIAPNSLSGSAGSFSVKPGASENIPDPFKDNYQIIADREGFVDIFVLSSFSPLDSFIDILQRLSAEAQEGILNENLTEVLLDYWSEINQNFNFLRDRFSITLLELDIGFNRETLSSGSR
ncbi:MAG: caspase family protein [Cyanothece sp. SIO1E1]|nr:caspase family protein [Cyanothece sp. SIO1E1]